MAKGQGSKSFFRAGITAGALTLLSLSQASAESPYRTEIQGNYAKVLTAASATSSGELSFSFTGRIMGAGRVKGKFTTSKRKNWNSYVTDENGRHLDTADVTLFQGTIEGSGAILPASGSVYNENGVPTLHLLFQSPRSMASRMMRVKVPLSGKEAGIATKPAQVSSLPAAAFLGKTCGTSTEEAHEMLQSAVPASPYVKAGATMKVATVATDADPEYYAVYGGNTNPHVATLLNAASVIYQNNLGIELQLASQHAFASSSGNPYTSSEAETLLDQFRAYGEANHHLGSADLYHMFSGKQWQGSTVGLAWVGVICTDPGYSYGITQRYHDGADATVLAHEIGHNFGAGHDESDEGSIMYPSISIPGSDRFSSTSKNQINSQLAQDSSCLSTTSSTPVPQPTATVAPTPRGDNPGDFTPNPTPTPGGDAPAISLRTKVFGDGTVSMAYAVEAIHDGCSISLYSSTSKGTLMKGGGDELFYEYTPEENVFVDEVKVPKSASGTVYLQAEYACESGEPSASAIVSIKPSKIKKSKTTLKKWYQTFVRKMRS